MTYGHVRKDNPSNGPITYVHKRRQGDLRTQRIRAVCRECNHGWMEAIERSASQILTPLIVGDPQSLDEPKAEVLARWIALKCMVVEHDRPGKVLTPRFDRLSMRETGAIPLYYNIFVASHSWKVAQHFEHHSANFYPGDRSDFPGIEGTQKNIEAISLVIGSVWFYVVASTLDDFDQQAQMEMDLLNPYRIWPINASSINYPSKKIFSENEVIATSRSLYEWLRIVSQPVYALRSWP